MTRLTATVIACALTCAACREAPAPARPAQTTTVTRPPVSWQGSGDRTLDFVSESGTFRITWEARPESPAVSGTFKLTVHSGVSGRPLQVIADQRGEGKATTIFQDDPRPYNLMVESANVQWSVTAVEIVTLRR